MYNPDFWEVRLDQTDLEQIPNEASIWFEPGEEQESRYRWEDRIKNLTARIVGERPSQKGLSALPASVTFQPLKGGYNHGDRRDYLPGM